MNKLKQKHSSQLEDAIWILHYLKSDIDADDEYSDVLKENYNNVLKEIEGFIK